MKNEKQIRKEIFNKVKEIYNLKRFRKNLFPARRGLIMLVEFIMKKK